MSTVGWMNLGVYDNDITEMMKKEGDSRGSGVGPVMDVKEIGL